MYERERQEPDDVIEGYNLHKDEIMKAWARYRPSYQKNINMFQKKKKKDQDNKETLINSFWDSEFLDHLLS
jgi:hypothetical protein